MMLIGHASDIHGNLSAIGSRTPDLWVVSGDFFPNYERPIIAAQEAAYQTKWANRHISQILSAFGDVPLVWCAGNHDFIHLDDVLIAAGKPNCYRVSPEGVVVAGMRFSGFREIPAIVYEWQGETMDFEDLLDRTFESNPDILVTHAPSAGMLDTTGSGRGYGISGLYSRLCYAPHQIQAHCHGHAHHDGGRVVEGYGYKVSNAATTTNYFEV